MAFERFDNVIGKLSRRRALGGASAVTAGIALASRLGGGLTAEAGPGTTIVGVGKYGRNAVEFLGQMEQSKFAFEFVGYLTLINLLDSTLMWTNSKPLDHKVENARFTIVAELTGVAKSFFETLFSMSATGDIRFFYNKPGGSSFNDPGTFSHGGEITSGSIRVQNTINATSDQDGIANGWGDIAIDKVTPFKIGGKSYQLFNKGLHLRLGFTGPGMLIDPDVPHSLVTLAGNGIVAK